MDLITATTARFSVPETVTVNQRAQRPALHRMQQMNAPEFPATTRQNVSRIMYDIKGSLPAFVYKYSAILKL